MEEISNVNWVLSGIRPPNDKLEIDDEVVKMIMLEAFMPGKKFDLYLCGEVVDNKSCTLQEMEDGYALLKSELKDYKFGDFGIVCTHTDGNLLFFPIDQTDENFSGNTDTAQ